MDGENHEQHHHHQSPPSDQTQISGSRGSRPPQINMTIVGRRSGNSTTEVGSADEPFDYHSDLSETANESSPGISPPVPETGQGHLLRLMFELRLGEHNVSAPIERSRSSIGSDGDAYFPSFPATHDRHMEFRGIGEFANATESYLDDIEMDIEDDFKHPEYEDDDEPMMPMLTN